MMAIEPKVQEPSAPSEVTVTTTTTVVDPGAISELSKRVDQTHLLVVGLDTRFEAHRQRTNEWQDKIMEGVSEIRTTQAEQAGQDTATEKGVSRRMQIKTNLIAAASVAAMLLAAASTVFAAVVPH